MGASPSTRNVVRAPELMRTISPMVIRSNGLSSTLNGMGSSLSRKGGSEYDDLQPFKKNIGQFTVVSRRSAFGFAGRRRRGLTRRLQRLFAQPLSAQELKHALL